MLVARDREKVILNAALDDECSQFIAVYGRRRVGKTFLVRESFGYKFAFEHAGIAGGKLAEQLFAFSESLREAGLRGFAPPTNWLEAFSLLKEVVRMSDEAKKVVFIDELSWMDTPRSDLMVALESFWNGWASGRRDVVLIVCASATSWMLDKVIHNKGGLYNRLNRQIHLRPFTLGECELYLKSRNINMSRHQVLEAYMILGGVPFYWTFMEKGMSLPQNIDAMLFAEDAPLRDEFDCLYASLFKRPEGHLAIVEALGTRKAGMTRTELSEATGLGSSKELTRKLRELESCGFIRRYSAYGKKSRDSLYQLIDNFTLFYYKFMRPKTTDVRFWANRSQTPACNAWRGLAFERVCIEHVGQIKAALGIAGVSTETYSWSCREDLDRGLFGSQIDLLIDRADHVVNVCEMKYSGEEYAITKAVDRDIKRRLSDFRIATKTRSALHSTVVTPYGLVQNSYAGDVQAVITADDLFS